MKAGANGPTCEQTRYRSLFILLVALEETSSAGLIPTVAESQHRKTATGHREKWAAGTGWIVWQKARRAYCGHRAPGDRALLSGMIRHRLRELPRLPRRTCRCGRVRHNTEPLIQEPIAGLGLSRCTLRPDAQQIPSCEYLVAYVQVTDLGGRAIRCSKQFSKQFSNPNIGVMFPALPDRHRLVTPTSCQPPTSQSKRLYPNPRRTVAAGPGTVAMAGQAWLHCGSFLSSTMAHSVMRNHCTLPSPAWFHG